MKIVLDMLQKNKKKNWIKQYDLLFQVTSMVQKRMAFFMSIYWNSDIIKHLSPFPLSALLLLM